MSVTASFRPSDYDSSQLLLPQQSDLEAAGVVLDDLGDILFDPLGDTEGFQKFLEDLAPPARSCLNRGQVVGTEILGASSGSSPPCQLPGCCSGVKELQASKLQKVHTSMQLEQPLHRSQSEQAWAGSPTMAYSALASTSFVRHCSQPDILHPPLQQLGLGAQSLCSPDADTRHQAERAPARGKNRRSARGAARSGRSSPPKPGALPLATLSPPLKRTLKPKAASVGHSLCKLSSPSHLPASRGTPSDSSGMALCSPSEDAQLMGNPVQPRAAGLEACHLPEHSSSGSGRPSEGLQVQLSPFSAPRMQGRPGDLSSCSSSMPSGDLSAGLSRKLSSWGRESSEWDDGSNMGRSCVLDHAVEALHLTTPEQRPENSMSNHKRSCPDLQSLHLPYSAQAVPQATPSFQQRLSAPIHPPPEPSAVAEPTPTTAHRDHLTWRAPENASSLQQMPSPPEPLMPLLADVPNTAPSMPKSPRQHSPGQPSPAEMESPQPVDGEEQPAQGPALKRAKSTTALAYPADLWQAVQPDAGLMTELKHLVRTKLDEPTQGQLKHALYRFASSASFNNGQAKRGWGYKCNQQMNSLVDMAVATLLYNRY
ncbi:hypothetical protein WJX84_002841 [Apatococcus fuscideae]|uniref:Uncharacterized protein n=1 Tax=Apatococcus fuscideae TaxID=2026836 RepID=A0AAW1ST15_9CHLO